MGRLTGFDVAPVGVVWPKLAADAAEIPAYAADLIKALRSMVSPLIVF